MVASYACFNKYYGKMSIGFFLNKWKRNFLEVFLQPKEKPWVPLKNGTRDFKNSPPFTRSTYFYVKITGDFENHWGFWTFSMF